MSSYNKVIIMGGLVRDPELAYTNANLAVCKITVAVTNTYKDKKDTAYVDCVAFGKQAELIDKYFLKGNTIHLDGRLKTDTWTDKTTNQKRSKLGVIVETITFMPRERGGGVGQQQQQRDPHLPINGKPQEPPPPDHDLPDTDIPF